VTAVLPPVIGHRGAAGLAPENTLTGLYAAAEAGCTWVEVDVRLSADGMPVLHHDPALPNGRRIATLPVVELAGTDVGSRFSPAFAGCTLPLLAAVLPEAARLDLGVNLELKTDAGDADALADATANLVTVFGITTPLLISSFDESAVSAAHHRMPELPRALLVRRPPADWRGRLESLGCCALNVADRHVAPDLVAAVRAAGFAVGVYTVNDPARARTLWEWGVTSVFTDRPDRVRAP